LRADAEHATGAAATRYGSHTTGEVSQEDEGKMATTLTANVSKAVETLFALLVHHLANAGILALGRD